MKLSIITINYNNLEGLKKTAKSVINQTWRDFEWIIVDGGSTDGSKEYIEELAKTLSDGKGQPASWKVEQFSLLGFIAEDMKNLPEDELSETMTHEPLTTNRLLWCSEPDNGIYNAMNKGIIKASGEYLNFMNSGDCFYEINTLKQVFSLDLNADIVYGSWIRRYKDFEEIINPADCGMNVLIYFGNICHQAMFILRNKIADGYNEKYTIFSDWNKWQMLACEGVSFKYVSYVICYFEAFVGQSEIVKDEQNEQLLILDDLPQGIRAHVLETRHFWGYDNYPIIDQIFLLIDKRPYFYFAFYMLTRIISAILTVLCLKSRVMGSSFMHSKRSRLLLSLF